MLDLLPTKRAQALWERSDREPKGSKGEASKKSNEGVDFGSKRSETQFIYILYICLIIYLAPPRALERQGFSRFMNNKMSVLR